MQIRERERGIRYRGRIFEFLDPSTHALFREMLSIRIRWGRGRVRKVINEKLAGGDRWKIIKWKVNGERTEMRRKEAIIVDIIHVRLAIHVHLPLEGTRSFLVQPSLVSLVVLLLLLVRFHHLINRPLHQARDRVLWSLSSLPPLSIPPLSSFEPSFVLHLYTLCVSACVSIDAVGWRKKKKKNEEKETRQREKTRVVVWG